MTRFIPLILALILSSAARADAAEIRDLYADTWVGVDALGRAMPTADEVGPLKTDQRRIVSIFYVTWHSDSLANQKSPYAADVTKILAVDPGARLDANHPLWTEGMYHWGEPENGYFLSRDTYVIRKDMSMLTDAGVDVLVMDVTNAVRYWDEWDTIFTTMQQMKAEGTSSQNSASGPLMACITVVQDLYENASTRRRSTRTSGSSGTASRSCSTTARLRSTPTARTSSTRTPTSTRRRRPTRITRTSATRNLRRSSTSTIRRK